MALRSYSPIFEFQIGTRIMKYMGMKNKGSTQKEEKNKGHECLILKNLRVLPVLVGKNEGSKAFKIAKFTSIWSKIPNLAHKSGN